MHLLKRTAVLLVFCGWFASSLPAQEKFTTPLIPREVLFGNPERADPQISPDGTQIGYLAPVDGVLNVWIRTLGKTDDRAVTADKHRGIRNFLWQYDNKHILYTQDAWRGRELAALPDRYCFQTDERFNSIRESTGGHRRLSMEFSRHDSGADEPARSKGFRRTSN